MARLFPAIAIKIFSFLVGTVFSYSILSAQNLVPNPSFEEGTGGTCEYTQAEMQFDGLAQPWINPTYTTPDILHLKPSDRYCPTAMPNGGGLGRQLPRTGIRFAGIISQNDYVWREYIEIALSSPLVPGQYYVASMYVSCAEEPNYASNNLGFYFSDSKVWNRKTEDVLPYKPQVYTTKVIRDTANWVQVCGAFKATSAATYLVIGNFFSEAETTKIKRAGQLYSDWSMFMSYYFIDDVSVEQVSSLTQPLPVDPVSAICLQESTQVSASGNYESIVWTTLSDTTHVLNNSNSFSVKPSQTTTYLGVAKLCGITYRDTITVKVNPLPKVNLGSDTVTCAGTQVTVHAGGGEASYAWQDSTHDESITVTKPGKYSVKVKNSFGCEASDEKLISYLSPPKVELGPDTLACVSLKELTALGNQRSVFHWSNGDTDSVTVPTSSGKYWVSIKNQCGSASDTIRIYTMKDAFTPNVVTLNADHLNEKFRIDKVPDTAFGVRIINRWGDVIFSDNAYKST